VARSAGGIQPMETNPRKHNSALTENARKLRRNMTKEERHLWYDFLRNYPVRFLRQKVIDQYIVDFYCREARLIVELDGSQHYNPEEMQYDQKRTEVLKQRGLEVIRIPNNEIFPNFRGVCEYIDVAVNNRL
jgi:very-short-patch-repair endonuclease